LGHLADLEAYIWVTLGCGLTALYREL